MASVVTSHPPAGIVVAARPSAQAPLPPWNGPGLSAPVHSWDLVAARYGPGTRFVLFTAGCPLRCLYCPTPEFWDERAGRPVGVGQVLAEADRYRQLFDLTGGGVTLSGGEPLLHHPFVAALARAARGEGIHLTLATPGVAADGVDDATLAALDLVLLDFKAYRPDTFLRTTGMPVGASLRLARRLAALGRPVRVRFVVVPGVTDDPADVEGLAGFLAGLGVVEHVDVIPFDRRAQDGWTAAGLDYPLALHPGPTREALAAVRRTFTGHGLAAG